MRRLALIHILPLSEVVFGNPEVSACSSALPPEREGGRAMNIVYRRGDLFDKRRELMAAKLHGFGGAFSFPKSWTTAGC
jgi:hypothetical protein